MFELGIWQSTVRDLTSFSGSDMQLSICNFSDKSVMWDVLGATETRASHRKRTPFSILLGCIWMQSNPCISTNHPFIPPDAGGAVRAGRGGKRQLGPPATRPSVQVFAGLWVGGCFAAPTSLPWKLTHNFQRKQKMDMPETIWKQFGNNWKTPFWDLFVYFWPICWFNPIFIISWDGSRNQLDNADPRLLLSQGAGRTSACHSSITLLQYNLGLSLCTPTVTSVHVVCSAFKAFKKKCGKAFRKMTEQR